jgi:hypothetical protein
MKRGLVKTIWRKEHWLIGRRTGTPLRLHVVSIRSPKSASLRHVSIYNHYDLEFFHLSPLILCLSRQLPRVKKVGLELFPRCEKQPETPHQHLIILNHRRSYLFTKHLPHPPRHICLAALRFVVTGDLSTPTYRSEYYSHTTTQHTRPHPRPRPSRTKYMLGRHN